MNEMKDFILNNQEVYRGNLILVNKNHPIKFSEREQLKYLYPALTDYKDILLRHHCALKFQQLLIAIKGHKKVIPTSGFRTRAEQERIYSDSMVEKGIEFTSKFVAYPNESEHQAGLAVDVSENQDNIDLICPSFPYSGICQEFRKFAPWFGFIERYPKGKEHITGIAHEPWHFRFVDYPHSEIIQRNNFTLEEYIDYLKSFPFENQHLLMNHNGGLIEIYYCECKSTQISITIPKDIPYQVSGNNVDGFIITVWHGASSQLFYSA